MRGVGSDLTDYLRGIVCADEGRYEEAEEAFLSAVQEESEMAGNTWR